MVNELSYLLSYVKLDTTNIDEQGLDVIRKTSSIDDDGITDWMIMMVINDKLNHHPCIYPYKYKDENTSYHFSSEHIHIERRDEIDEMIDEL